MEGIEPESQTSGLINSRYVWGPKPQNDDIEPSRQRRPPRRVKTDNAAMTTVSHEVQASSTMEEHDEEVPNAPRTPGNASTQRHHDECVTSTTNKTDTTTVFRDVQMPSTMEGCHGVTYNAPRTSGETSMSTHHLEITTQTCCDEATTTVCYDDRQGVSAMTPSFHPFSADALASCTSAQRRNVHTYPVNHHCDATPMHPRWRGATMAPRRHQWHLNGTMPRRVNAPTTVHKREVSKS